MYEFQFYKNVHYSAQSKYFTMIDELLMYSIWL